MAQWNNMAMPACLKTLNTSYYSVFHEKCSTMFRSLALGYDWVSKMFDLWDDALIVHNTQCLHPSDEFLLTHHCWTLLLNTIVEHFCLTPLLNTSSNAYICTNYFVSQYSNLYSVDLSTLTLPTFLFCLMYVRWWHLWWCFALITHTPVAKLYLGLLFMGPSVCQSRRHRQKYTVWW